MNQKKSRQLRRKAEDLLIEWLRTMVPDGEDTSKINKKNIDFKKFFNKLKKDFLTFDVKILQKNMK